MFGIIRRFADEKIRRELADVRAELDAERRFRKIAECEVESMAAVIARDRLRVKSESAEFAARIAAPGGE